MVAVTLIGPLSVHAFIPALPMVQRAFAIGDAAAQSMLSITLLGMAASTLFYGSLSDRYGRRPVLLSGIGLFLIGATVCAVSTDVVTLASGRFVQAAGAGCGLVLARAIIRDVYGDDRLVKMMAYLTMAYVMGPMLAPPIGGALIDAFGWRAVFYLGLALGVAIFALTAIATHETAPRNHGGDEAGFGRRLIQGYARLARMPKFLGYVLHAAFIAAAFFSYVSSASFLMSDVLHRPASEYGIYFLFLPLAYLVGNFFASRLSGRVSIATMVVIGGVGAMVVAIGFVIWASVSPIDPLLLFVPGVVASIAQGLSMPNAQSGAIQVDADLTGAASGAVMFAQLSFGAIGAQVMGFVADGTVYPMAVMFLVCCALSLVSGIVPAFIRNRQT
jgi:DHA1 family bicyclomycin/chloramphenicol resistance-like MFS transporter